MHRPDWDLVDTLTAHRQKGEGRAVVRERFRRYGVFPQRKERLRPEGVPDQRAVVGASDRLDAK